MRKSTDATLKVVRFSTVLGISNRALAVVLCTLGCSGSASVVSGSAQSGALAGLDGPGDAYQQFDRAFRAMAEHDAADDWTDARCNEVANAFIGAWKADNRLREGLYDAGVAHMRCHHVSEAR